MSPSTYDVVIVGGGQAGLAAGHFLARRGGGFVILEAADGPGARAPCRSVSSDATCPGNAFKDVITGDADLLVTKSVNSSFHGDPSLQAWLDGEGIRAIYACGITTNHCCETTARVGGNLGYDVRFVLDATHTFDRADPFGGVVAADELARVTATNLHGEFATVVDTATALSD